jgi:hypothetical protein
MRIVILYLRHEEYIQLNNLNFQTLTFLENFKNKIIKNFIHKAYFRQYKKK